MPVPVAARSKARVCDRSLVGTTGSNPTEDMDVSCKKNQLDAQIILSIFLQLLHVSGVFRPIIRRYNHMYTAIGNYYFL